jgi:hypothetical protein
MISERMKQLQRPVCFSPMTRTNNQPTGAAEGDDFGRNTAPTKSKTRHADVDVE